MHVPTNNTRVELPIKTQYGVALLEVLVAILLFTLGVLALIGLQASLTRAQTEAQIRGDASALASEIIGQMWGDLRNLSNYDGDACAETASCKAWQDKVASSLPSGAGVLTVTAGTGDVAVALTWTTQDRQQHQYTTQTNIAPARARTP